MAVYILVLKSLMQMGLCEFAASLAHIVRSRRARAFSVIRLVMMAKALNISSPQFP